MLLSFFLDVKLSEISNLSIKELSISDPLFVFLCLLYLLYYLYYNCIFIVIYNYIYYIL